MFDPGGGGGHIPGDTDPFAGIGVNGPVKGGIQQDELIGMVLDTGITVDELVGAELEGTTTDGQSAVLKITGIASGVGAHADLLYYAVYAADGPDWVPLCGESAEGEPIPALALPGEWDYTSGTQTGGSWENSGREFSFACRGSSIAKCMEAGYKPWVSPESSDGTLSYRDKDQADRPNHLQACVRMLRADYCGDGISHTINGRNVEFWDSMGVHEKSRSWTVEAAWGPEGAYSVTGEPRVRIEDRSMPSCYTNRIIRASGVDQQLYEDAPTMASNGILLSNSYERQIEIELDDDDDDDDDD